LIRHISSPEHIVSLSGGSFEESIQEIVDRLLAKALPSVRWSLCKAIMQREKLRHTVLPNGVAFPRAETQHVRKIICGVGIFENPITEGNRSDAPIHAMFVTLYPKGQFGKFVTVLENLVRFSEDPEKMAALRKLSERKEEFRIIRDEVFPWGIRGFIHSHSLSSIHRVHNRM